MYAESNAGLPCFSVPHDSCVKLFNHNLGSPFVSGEGEEALNEECQSTRVKEQANIFCINFISQLDNEKFPCASPFILSLLIEAALIYILLLFDFWTINHVSNHFSILH